MTRKFERGFTLIELLIVIVIIGILAGVLIAVINPAQQQNRARDANVIATMNKAALSAEAFNSAYGRAATGAEFIAGVQNGCPRGQTWSGTACTGTITAGSGCGAADNFCLFGVTGNALPVGGTAGCATNGWNGNDVNQCFFRYERVGAASTNFRVYAKSFGIVNTVFQYDNTVADIEECSSTGSFPC